MVTIGEIEEARGNVRDVEDHITRQKEHIEDLAHEGVDTYDAKALLKIYEETRQQLELRVEALLSEFEREARVTPPPLK